MPKSEPPVIILDGSLKIEVDEPVDIDAEFCDLAAHRPFRYKHRMDKGHKHIRHIVVKKGDRTVFDDTFEEKECRIEIYWEQQEVEPVKSASKKKKK